MSTALYAHRILQAWNRFNYARFEAEVESALSACRASGAISELENEERAVLESVVTQLRRFPAVSDGDDRCWFEAHFLLLRHLETR